MSIKITNDKELAQARRDLETFDRYNLYPDTARRIREAISKYDKALEDARVAEIAAGLSENAKERMVWLGTREEARSIKIAVELESKGLESTRDYELTHLGVKVLAELQNVKPPSPERWGVLGNDSQHTLYCECLNPADAKLMVAALWRYGLSTHVREP